MRPVILYISPPGDKLEATIKQELGEDVDFPSNIGIIIENPEFVPYYSGYKNLKLLADVKQRIGKEEDELNI